MLVLVFKFKIVILYVCLSLEVRIFANAFIVSKMLFFDMVKR